MKAAEETGVREQAAETFQRLGWPTSRMEEWRYTNLAPLSRISWKEGEAASLQDVDALLADGKMAGAAIELVFVNGRLDSRRSRLEGHPSLQAGSRAAGPEADRGEETARLMEGHALTALNIAESRDGAVVNVPGGVVAEGFVHLLFIGSGEEIWAHPRNLISAGPSSQVTVVESYLGAGSCFTNAVTEIEAGDGAVIEHYKLVRDSDAAFHVGRLVVRQERSSSVTSYTVTVGGAVVRNEIDVLLDGPGANCTLNGLFILSGTQHADNHITVDHSSPHCESTQLFRGILDQKSRGIFEGRVIVRKDAQKTNSRQTNNNLLLSESAIVDSKPTLEIHNDDVKCNHGSTIGQLAEESMFYLRSRGIGEEEARGFLIYGFASDLVDRMKLDEAREVVRRTMFRQLPGKLPERREGAR